MYSLMQLMEPVIRLVFYKGIGLWGGLALIAYNLYIAWNLNAEGMAGDNVYGPDPLEG
ncbi:MAG: hypothetical protein WDN06_00025 [Asticcacaulis sp.]